MQESEREHPLMQSMQTDLFERSHAREDHRTKSYDSYRVKNKKPRTVQLNISKTVKQDQSYDPKNKRS